jgi:hypothetical protein
VGAGVKGRDKERLVLGLLWVAAAAAMFAMRGRRFDSFWYGQPPAVLGLCTGWLLRSFFPPRQEWERFSGLTTALYVLVALFVVGMIAIVLSN